MPDQQGTDTEMPEPEDNNPRGFMVYVAIVLIGILIVMVVFMQVSGMGSTAATSITETTWSLESLSDPDGTTTPVINGTTITAQFRTDGTLAGSGGCNHYSARYLVKETMLVISQVTTTEMYCSGDGVMSQESRYYAALQDAAALRIHDRSLRLYDVSGKPLLSFVPAPAGN